MYFMKYFYWCIGTIALTLLNIAVDSKACDTTPYVTRNLWNAQPAKLIEHFDGPIPFVIIHHSYVPGLCNSELQCINAMQQMQKMHQDVRKWNDIGYSFAVGGDGRVYQGRGFNVVGAHAPRYNDRSVGICLIGDWIADLPPKIMLTATQHLIEYGVRNSLIAQNYTLIGHRQVRSTECPGDRLFEEIKTWTQFSPMTDIVDKDNV